MDPADFEIGGHEEDRNHGDRRRARRTSRVARDQQGRRASTREPPLGRNAGRSSGSSDRRRRERSRSRRRRGGARGRGTQSRSVLGDRGSRYALSRATLKSYFDNRFRITRIASALSSTSTASRPSSAAASPSVPLPAKKSSSVSPGFECTRTMRAQDAERLLRRVTRFFFSGRAHDRVPPHVGRRLSARGFLRPDEPGRHVRDAVDFVVVEACIASGSFAYQRMLSCFGGQRLSCARRSRTPR